MKKSILILIAAIMIGGGFVGCKHTEPPNPADVEEWYIPDPLQPEDPFLMNEPFSWEPSPCIM